ncbi:hypothetical protein SAMD00019534_013890 [Acytostelium subglobosum LB1]|uniref:hypothetical protein n=1 Tax=Acytostelium subglobosum LB1 TaxID=1410327 RepID=UPI00064499AD|nr:hypothetical protein SAMD00019534_013890 [Acytostelium subglobosum LB1]GAM18214.1 hypothetical protein SAMD00019534_013890 [Acytostelium subglobosum LB1]|eukprot:XP_012758810.1 hypothetical protein SAMD00019534_013890 [Acytostelium subglobosum LB1]
MQQQQQQGENVIISAYPPPPPFYKLYLNYQHQHQQSQQQQQSSSATSTPGLNPISLNSNSNNNDKQLFTPPASKSPTLAATTTTTTTTSTTSPTNVTKTLQPLPPPLPPKQGSTYSMFGQPYATTDVLPSLSEQGVQQLYPDDSISPIKELKKLNRSILFNYLQLLETLVENPQEYKKKVDDISLLFINFHHLLNSYRPHQARETLISIMSEQLKQKRESISKINSTLESCKVIFNQSLQSINTEEIERLRQRLQQDVQQLQHNTTSPSLPSSSSSSTTTTTTTTTTTSTSAFKQLPLTPKSPIILNSMSSSSVPAGQSQSNKVNWKEEYLSYLSNIPKDHQDDLNE